MTASLRTQLHEAADVLLMPGVREIVIRRLPLERRKELLRDLARDCWDMEPEAVEVLLTAFAHDSLTGPALRAAWLEYRARLELTDDEACHGRNCAGTEIARQDADDALQLLAGGRS